MNKALLAELGIPDTLPPEELLERLKDKNLEYLERLSGCSDANRAAELEKRQKEIENAIILLSSGITLSRQVTDSQQHTQPGQAAGGAQSNDAAQYAYAIAEYQAGNHDNALPIFASLAEQHVMAAILAGNILLQKGQQEEAIQYLGIAALAGDGTAMVMLSHIYLDMGIYTAAERWSRRAMELKVPKSGVLLFRVLKTKDMSPLLEELSFTQGYEQFELVQLIATYANNKNLQEVEKVYKLIHDNQQLHQIMMQNCSIYAGMEPFFKRGGKGAPLQKISHFWARLFSTIMAVAWIVITCGALGILWESGEISNSIGTLIVIYLYCIPICMIMRAVVKIRYLGVRRSVFRTSISSFGSVLFYMFCGFICTVIASIAIGIGHYVLRMILKNYIFIPNLIASIAIVISVLLIYVLFICQCICSANGDIADTDKNIALTFSER